MARGWHLPQELEGVEHPVPRLVDEHYGARNQWRASWYDPPFLPDARLVDQVYGICFDNAGSILLVCSPDAQGDYWNLPGGGLEDGEGFEGCLIREVAEEACAQVVASAYLGCQRVDEYNAWGHVERSCYQLGYWARVELDEWLPAHETTERRLIQPDQFLQTLAWGAANTARLILEMGLAQEDRR